MGKTLWPFCVLNPAGTLFSGVHNVYLQIPFRLNNYCLVANILVPNESAELLAVLF